MNDIEKIIKGTNKVINGVVDEDSKEVIEGVVDVVKGTAMVFIPVFVGMAITGLTGSAEAGQTASGIFKDS